MSLLTFNLQVYTITKTKGLTPFSALKLLYLRVSYLKKVHGMIFFMWRTHFFSRNLNNFISNVEKLSPATINLIVNLVSRNCSGMGLISVVPLKNLWFEFVFLALYFVKSCDF